jgi:hypothetical protein
MLTKSIDLCPYRPEFIVAYNSWDILCLKLYLEVNDLLDMAPASTFHRIDALLDELAFAIDAEYREKRFETVFVGILAESLPEILTVANGKTTIQRLLAPS